MEYKAVVSWYPISTLPKRREKRERERDPVNSSLCVLDFTALEPSQEPSEEGKEEKRKKPTPSSAKAGRLVSSLWPISRELLADRSLSRYLDWPPAGTYSVRSHCLGLADNCCLPVARAPYCGYVLSSMTRGKTYVSQKKYGVRGSTYIAGRW